MLKIGRYKIAFGPVLWFQTKVPVRVRHFLCFWSIKEARPQDVDRKQQFPPGTPMEHEGRFYRYYRVGSAIPAGQVIPDEEGAEPAPPIEES